MTFIFDDRPHRKRENRVVFDAFQRHIRNPSLVGIAFLTSHKVLPLQAADLIAWEFYQHARDILVEGLRTPRRQEFARFGEELGPGVRLVGQIALRERIAMIVNYWNQREGPDDLRQIADHFTFFDPDNPDYSQLSDEKSS